MVAIVPTLFDYRLSDIHSPQATLSKQQAIQLFIYFKHHPLFNWKAVHNGCEGRADAVCVLLEIWGLPHYKSWVFGGAYLKQNHIGALKNNWKYHVAPVLPVQENNTIVYYVLDPSTTDALQPVEAWAGDITLLPHSYYCLRMAHWYIFPIRKISTTPWNSRNRQNRKWMIQALAGINGLSGTGKARLGFKKKLLKATALAFEKAKKEKPF